MRTDRLRVLVVTPTAVLGGAESWLLSMLDGSDRLDVEVLLLADGPLREALAARAIPAQVDPVGARARDMAAASVRLAARLQRADHDVVVANGLKAQVVVGPAAAVTGIPAVWVKHDFSHDRRLARPLGRLATRVVATASEVGAAVRRDDVEVVEPPRPSVEPLPRDVAAAALAALGVRGSGRPRLVMAGRLVPYKGVDTAIEALGMPGGEDWELVVIGDDEPKRPAERERLLALARRTGVADRVQPLRHVPDVSRLLTAADAVAVLTRPDGPRTPGREGFGMIAMEAGLAGVPVVAVDDGGPIARRLGAGGVLVPAATPQHVSAALGSLRDPGVRRRMGRSGREAVERQPTAAEAAARFSSLLAIAAHRPGAGVVGGGPVSVVSPVLDERATIAGLVDAVAAQFGPGDEYVLVDGGSTDGTVEWLRARAERDPRVRVVHVPPETSIGAARNAGVRAARHDGLAFTDAGCLPGPGWVEACRSALAEPGVELAVGTYRVAVREGSAFEAAMAASAWPDPLELRRRTPGRRLYGRCFGRRFDPTKVDGRSLAMTRAAWERAGGFPEHLRTAEDEAFGRAAGGAGVTSVLTLDAEVVWRQRGSVAATFRQFRGYGEGGGVSRSPRLLARDGVRTAGYVMAAIAAVRGGRAARSAVALGAVGYLSLPVARVLRRGQPPLTIMLLPGTLLLKDVAKLVGTARTLALGRAGISRRRT